MPHPPLMQQQHMIQQEQNNAQINQPQPPDPFDEIASRHGNG
jgi:hypothetical protein